MVMTFGPEDELRSARFVAADLREARFAYSDISGVVMREAQVDEVDIDAPWLTTSGSYFKVNGVDITPYVEAELNRRFPGRELRRAESPDGLREAHAAVERAWAAALDHAATMPEGSVVVSVDGEWSFAQTLRHLVLATDVWLRKAILEIPQPYHPLGLAFAGAADEGLDMSVFTTTEPAYAEVLEARADRVAMVRDFVAAATDDDLDVVRRNPWAPQHAETTRSCLQVVFEEEWEHLRYALRDLDLVAVRATGGDERESSPAAG